MVKLLLIAEGVSRGTDDDDDDYSFMCAFIFRRIQRSSISQSIATTVHVCTTTADTCSTKLSSPSVLFPFHTIVCLSVLPKPPIFRSHVRRFVSAFLYRRRENDAVDGCQLPTTKKIFHRFHFFFITLYCVLYNEVFVQCPLFACILGGYNRLCAIDGQEWIRY
jgi:hypothetical protein